MQYTVRPKLERNNPSLPKWQKTDNLTALSEVFFPSREICASLSNVSGFQTSYKFLSDRSYTISSGTFFVEYYLQIYHLHFPICPI